MTLKRTLHAWHCALRDGLGVKPPKTLEALSRAQARVDEAGLRQAYAGSEISRAEHSCALYRIIGNDLPPRHAKGQALRNLKFILEYEAGLESCEKIFVVNRIVDSGVERAILDLLEANGANYLRIPFDPAVYASIPLDYACLPGGDKDYLRSASFRRLRRRHKIRLLTAVNRPRNLYVMNNNGARNLALNDGAAKAKWVLPFDGNCFLTESALAEINDAMRQRPWLTHFVLPMARIHDNNRLLDADFRPEAGDEPQLAFRADARSRFNEAFPYGRFSKIEMFWHLGIPGNWSYTVEKAWDPPRRELSDEAGQFGVAGWVARLFSGKAGLEASGPAMGAVRGDARRAAMLDLFARLDREYAGGCRFPDYPDGI